MTQLQTLYKMYIMRFINNYTFSSEKKLFPTTKLNN